MPERSGIKYKPMRIGLLGASFETGNMGVSALAESTMKIILNRWPDAEILFLRSGRVPRQQDLVIIGRQVSVTKLPIRFSKNIFLPYHFLSFVFYGLLAKVLPGSRAKDALLNRNPHFKMLYETDLVADITGGDSFSDIYGFGRFFLGFLCKWLVVFLGKKLVLLPQTYGPFRRRLTKIMAKYILRRANLVYSRDKAGIEYVTNMLSKDAQDGKVRFAPDVAFVLDSRKPKHLAIEPSVSIRTRGSVVVGINISGLLFNGGYTRDNMFKLKNDYRKLIYATIEMLLEDQRIAILLVPHVFPPAGCEVESDLDACQQVYEQIRQKYFGRIFLMVGEHDQSEIKYIIGSCDFFIGSRMHACIAALSQYIPAVGLAYSKKFRGVFETVDAEQFVVDMRYIKSEQILTTVTRALEQKQETASHLKTVVPGIQKQIFNLFKDIS